jgi:hypothetical protein
MVRFAEASLLWNISINIFINFKSLILLTWAIRIIVHASNLSGAILRCIPLKMACFRVSSRVLARYSYMKWRFPKGDIWDVYIHTYVCKHLETINRDRGIWDVYLNTYHSCFIPEGVIEDLRYSSETPTSYQNYLDTIPDWDVYPRKKTTFNYLQRYDQQNVTL